MTNSRLFKTALGLLKDYWKAYQRLLQDNVKITWSYLKIQLQRWLQDSQT